MFEEGMQTESLSNKAALQTLVKLGLTRDEARCYTLLLTKGSLVAKQIAAELNILPPAVYRLADNLHKKGFVIELEGAPRKFQAIPASVAIENFYTQKEGVLEELKSQSLLALSKTYDKKSPQTRVEVITSKADYFSQFISLSKDCKEEILVISIGEPVPDEIKLATRDTLVRRVVSKFIFHRYDKDNQDLLKTWVRMGCEVRHFPDSGYHMNIFDGKKSILVANNPEDVSERAGITIYSEGVSRALRTYFYSIWEKAVQIKIS